MRATYPSLVTAAVAAAALGGARPTPAEAQVDVRPARDVPALARAWIGINLHALEEHGPEGVHSRLMIRGVVEGSPADDAHVRPGDRILRVNGQTATIEAFTRMATRLRPGDALEVTLLPGGGGSAGGARTVSIRAAAKPAGEMVELSGEIVVRLDSTLQRLRITGPEGGAWTVRTGPGGAPLPLTGTAHMMAVGPDSSRTLLLYPTGDGLSSWTRVSGGRTGFLRRVPTPPAPAASSVAEADSAAATFRPLTPYIAGRNRVAGAGMTPLNAQLASYFEVEAGLLVTDVAEGTPAGEAGLVPGDVVVRVGALPVRSLEDLRRALTLPGQRDLSLEVVRRGERIRVRLAR